jgi:hypothetical protein
LAAFVANAIDNEAMALNLELMVGGKSIPHFSQFGNFNVHKTLTFDAVQVLGRF